MTADSTKRKPGGITVAVAVAGVGWPLAEAQCHDKPPGNTYVQGAPLPMFVGSNGSG